MNFKKSNERCIGRVCEKEGGILYYNLKKLKI